MKSEDKIKRTKPKRQIHSKESKGQNANLTKKDKGSIILSEPKLVDSEYGSYEVPDKEILSSHHKQSQLNKARSFLTWHFLKETAMKSVKAIRTKRSGAWKALLLAGAAIAVAIGITACGGGGSDSGSTNPPVVTPPVVTPPVVTPPTACAAPGQVNAYGACMQPPVGGAFAKDSATGNVRPATAADFTWNPTAKVWMANIGVKITDPQQISCAFVSNTLGLGDDCWKKVSADGTVKFAMSGMKFPSDPTRQVMYAYYSTNTPAGYKVYQRFPIWANDNTAAWGNPPAHNGGNTFPTDFAYGTDEGFVVHDSTGCWERFWDSKINDTGSRSVVCKY